MKSKRLTIGLLQGYIEDDYNNAFAKGAMEAAEELDCNLVIIPGKYFGLIGEGSSRQYEYEYQHNTMFSYVTKNNIDAIIVCLGIIGPFTDKKRGSKEEFLSIFEGIPMITVSEKVDGVPCISYDNKEGIKEGIRYLIERQKCERIAMVTGDRGSDDGEERLLAYKDALLEADMEIEEELIRYSNFSVDAKSDVLDLLSKDSEIDAIVFANDWMAMGGYEAAEELGLVVGRDIAFMGFDDIPTAIGLNPPLATVRAGIETLGFESMQMVKRFLQEGAAADVSLPTKFIVRESVGSSDDHGNTVEELLSRALRKEITIMEVGEILFEGIVDGAISKKNAKDAAEQYEKLWQSVATVYEKESCTLDDCQLFFELFEEYISQEFMDDIDINKLARIYDCTGKVFFRGLKEEASRVQLASKIAFHYRKMLESMTRRINRIKLSNRETMHITNHITKSMFAFDNGSDQSYQAVLENLHLIGIRRSFLFLFESPMINLQGDHFEMPKTFKLVATQNGNSTTILPQKKQAVKLDELFSRCFTAKERGTLISAALFVNENMYGFLLCDIPHERFHCYEWLDYLASNAAKMIHLLESENETQKQLEESMALLKENNIHLDTISKRDELTGVFNRRGFMTAANELIKDKANVGKYVLTAYADTDNLKIINDRYGHDEGDFALVSSSDILRNAFEEKGIIGRIGGDEFAALVITDNLEDEKFIREQIVKDLEYLNRESGKPYVVGVSVGMSFAKIKAEMEISDLLERADALLYKEKKFRKKDVSKEALYD